MVTSLGQTLRGNLVADERGTKILPSAVSKRAALPGSRCTRAILSSNQNDSRASHFEICVVIGSQFHIAKSAANDNKIGINLKMGIILTGLVLTDNRIDIHYDIM